LEGSLIFFFPQCAEKKITVGYHRQTAFQTQVAIGRIEAMAAGSTSSSLTSTSHTLTFTPGMSVSRTSGMPAATEVSGFVDSLRLPNRHAFLQPPPSLPVGSLNFVKSTLDAFAGQVSDEQLQRLKDANNKRKRSAERTSDRGEVLKIRRLHVDGFETPQIWQQAKRIISSALTYSQDALQELQESNAVTLNGQQSKPKELRFDEEGFEVDSDEEEEGSEDSDSQSEASSEEEGGESDEGSEAGLDDQDLNEDEGGEDDIDAEQGEDEEDADADEPAEIYVEDPNGLNDGFFSIDDFNRQTQWFEEQDAKGDPYTDQASDDEDVDWNTDPLAEPKSGKSGKNQTRHDEVESEQDEDDEDEEDGPTFGNMDLNAPEGDSEDEDQALDANMGEETDFNANDVYYKDFFAPPSRKGSKGSKPRKAVRFEPEEPDEKDIQRAMDDVRRDLFDDLSDHDDSEDALSDVSAGDPRSRRSNHERRQAKLVEEIRKLEAASIAKREWTLSGEAAAVDRPLNSLLEETVDFEHVGKPVPVITPEVSEGIEEMIKRRILAQEFDEVIRRRPDASDVPSETRRGLVELQDTKAEKGLAEMYEEEHVKAANPDSYVSKSDEKLRKEEKEIEQMWKDLSAKLDGLSSWHYKPKPVPPTLTVVSDVAIVSMEDAQPTTAQGVSGGSSMIAPQEIYKAGKDSAEKGEIIAKSGLPVARQEMSREEKLRRRRREKERIRKSGNNDGKKTISKAAQSKKDTMAELKKGGVKVINRKGEIMDIDGNKAKTAKPVSSGSYKL
jgi:U3 small nucleolar RNA-associated protein MPP10